MSSNTTLTSTLTGTWIKYIATDGNDNFHFVGHSGTAATIQYRNYTITNENGFVDTGHAYYTGQYVDDTMMYTWCFFDGTRFVDVATTRNNTIKYDFIYTGLGSYGSNILTLAGTSPSENAKKRPVNFSVGLTYAYTYVGFTNGTDTLLSGNVCEFATTSSFSRTEKTLQLSAPSGTSPSSSDIQYVRLITDGTYVYANMDNVYLQRIKESDWSKTGGVFTLLTTVQARVRGTGTGALYCGSLSSSYPFSQNSYMPWIQSLS